VRRIAVAGKLSERTCQSLFSERTSVAIKRTYGCSAKR
jgi:hypothetical protein